MEVPAALARRLPAALAVGLRTARDGVDRAALPPAEAARLDAFGHADRRAGFGLGRTAVRHLAAARLGGAPADVPLGLAPDGAPTLPGLHVSIAHAGRGAGVTAAAALHDRAVGVDLEPVVERRADLWTRILTPGEHALLAALGGPTGRAQTLLWSLKEAVLKGQRTGLRAGARSVSLRLDAPGDGAVPDAGTGRAQSDRSGAWRLAWARADVDGAADGSADGLWLCVAWAAEADGAPDC